ncbi:phosphatase PAP2 family protein [Natronorubrum halophilum]|uniref:phosphatase PAP2 family protein n=1 Tax=Natronorubrum halophilum TaxID=1702106 RepID=UPI000EF681E1|nr:phosphatase PAP2 family protein [Natronorubrum halophilum]
MFRGGDVLEAVHDSVPEWVLLLAALVTRLGDVWIVISVAIAASWVLTWGRANADSHRQEHADSSRDAPTHGSACWLVGVVVGGLAAMTALKYLFALPRPELVAATPAVLPTALESTYVSTVTVGGYGLPSGHAIGATVAYGLLALTIRTGTRRVRLAVAAVLVGAISLSRVVLAVHYPADIVAGIAVGVGYLAAILWLLERSPFDRTSTAFASALGLALVAMAVSGSGGRSVTYAALAAGGLAAWSIGRPRPRSPPTPRTTYHAETATTALALLAGLVVLEGGPMTVVPAAALGALAIAPALVVPRWST